MVNGGRSIEGNRLIGEDGSAQAHRQPQGGGKPGWAGSAGSNRRGR